VTEKKPDLTSQSNTKKQINLFAIILLFNSKSLPYSHPWALHKFFHGRQHRHFVHCFQVADDAMQMDVHKMLYLFQTTNNIRPYQIWANVSDLYVSWSKVAVGLNIHKNDKKLNQLSFDASSMCVSIETI